MIFSSIIFDLDGTLLDTLTDISESVNTVLAMNDFPTHPYERYKSFVGDGLQKLMIRSVPAGTAESVVHACCDKFVEIYSENWKKNCIPFEGITAMLSDLRAQGCKLAVLSNKPHAFTCRFVDQFFQKDLFEVVFGQREGVDKKPHPAGALAIAERLHTRPESMLFVGDSDVDIQTGRAAGMRTAGVSWGYRDVGELIENKADVIAGTPSEIVDYVLSAS